MIRKAVEAIRPLIPGPLYGSLSVLKRFRRAQAQDRCFREEVERYTLREELFQNLKVVPDRNAILRACAPGGVIAEIGVAAGEFSAEILRICRPKKLYLIDLWAADSPNSGARIAAVLARFAREIESGQVEVVRGFSWDVISGLPDATLDFAYVDASHDFDSVYKDLIGLRTKMRPSGMIAGHDYARWSGNGLHRWGVVEAVNIFCNEQGWEMRYLSHEPGRLVSYGLTRVAPP